MDSAIGQALLKVRTSNQWSLLDGVARKMGVKTGELHHFLEETDSETLRLHGIWKHKAGKCFIICTNPGYRQVVQAAGCECNCGATKTAVGEGDKRYFGSMDYNAGRHAFDASEHKTSCPLWTPPTSGHLFSWRRGYEL